MIRWGIVGLGKMAGHFANAIKETNNAKLIAISSTRNRNLHSFGDKFEIDSKFRFEEYSKIIKCPEIDAVYISTLNNTHFELIKLCALNKKNILCEKPFCLDLVEANYLKKIIINNNVKFFEAIAYLSHPITKKIFDLINNNEIGEVESIESSYGFKIKRISSNYSRLFTKKLGGGSILDLGCYPLSFISLFNDNKNNLDFKSITKKINKNNIDTVATANILIKDKINCRIEVSLENDLNNITIVYGSKGRLLINQPWLPEKKTFLEVVTKLRSYKIFVNSDLSVYANQIRSVSDEFLGKSNNKLELFEISQSVENMKYLDFWIKNSG